MKWLLLIFGLTLGSVLAQSTRTILFVGSYTAGVPDTGIYIYEFNNISGSLSLMGEVDSITNPSYLTVSGNGKYVYACMDTKLPQEGSVAAFQFNFAEGTLTKINQQTSGGDNPVYISTNQNNSYLINANYSGGSACLYAINENGGLYPMSQLIKTEGSSIIASRQEKSHPHSVVFSPDEKFVFIPDLGADIIRVFQFDSTATQPLVARKDLDFVSIPGSGPRHFTFHPNGKFAYAMDELSGTVSAFQYEDGSITFIQKIFAYSQERDDYNSADIHVSPDGKYLYASNRLEGENTIAIFSVDQQTGQLELVGHQSTLGDHPRNFTIDPSGNFLLVANQLSNNIVVFRRDTLTGLLTKTDHEITVPAPSCLKMMEYSTVR